MRVRSTWMQQPWFRWPAAAAVVCLSAVPCIVLADDPEATEPDPVEVQDTSSTEVEPEPPPLLAAELPAPEAPSLSIGDSLRGELRGGVELPRRAPGLFRLSVVSARNSGWGTRDLVELVQRVASELQQLPEHRDVALRIGNLSLRRGGEMRWSHSHRGGRDVDVLLYLVDADGQPVQPDQFVVLDRHGKGRWRKAPVYFDVARTWHVVRALLRDSHVQVQHLYLAEPLRQRLLAHARATGEPEWLLQRARLVVSEPGHSGRHDDHLHVRLYCSRDDRLAGCSDESPRWPWVQGYDHDVRRQVGQLIAELAEPAAERRAQAITRLAWFQRHDPRAVAALVWAASTDADNHAAALDALVRMQEPAAFASLMQAARAMADGERTLALLLAALQVAAPEHAPEVSGLLAPDCGVFGDRLDQSMRSRLRAAVAQVVRPWLLEETAAPLVGVLTDPDVTARRAALRTLEFLANRRFAHEAAAAAWYEQAAGLGRLHWLHEGFARRGLPVSGPPHVLAPALIDLLSHREPHVAANAEALLRRVLGRGPGDVDVTAVRRKRAWARWWDVHRHRYAWGDASRQPREEASGAAAAPAVQED